MKEEVSSSAQLCVMTEERLAHHFSNRTVFASHLAREGQVVTDPERLMSTLFEAFPAGAPVLETAAGLQSRLQAYSDLSWCGGYYLFCFSDLYALSRSGAMLALARAGEFEFGRAKVFDRLARLHPDLEEEIETTRGLRPFWERVNRGAEIPLPFVPTGSHREAEEARDACRAILAKSL